MRTGSLVNRAEDRSARAEGEPERGDLRPDGDRQHQHPTVRTKPAASLRPRPSALGPLKTAPGPLGRALVLVIALVLLAPAAAQACAVCYGAPGDPMVKGVNNGIWVLLGFVGFVQVGFVAMFWTFWKRTREQRRFRESFRLIRSSEEGGPTS